MDTSLIINATNSGKKIQKAITNINPEKDNATLKTFAQKVNALTTNEYIDATRVNKMSVNESSAGKPEPTFTISNGAYTYDGDGDIFGYIANTDGSPITNAGLKLNRTQKTWAMYPDTGAPTKVILHATETANFAAKTASYDHGF